MHFRSSASVGLEHGLSGRAVPWGHMAVGRALTTTQMFGKAIKNEKNIFNWRVDGRSRIRGAKAAQGSSSNGKPLTEVREVLSQCIFTGFPLFLICAGSPKIDFQYLWVAVAEPVAGAMRIFYLRISFQF